MKFLFENFLDSENFINCPDLNKSGIKRFTPSPIVSDVPLTNKFKFYQWWRPTKYIISSGVAHHPHNWAGGVHGQNTNIKNVFYYLNKTYLKDLQNHRAMLLLDQSHEAYQTAWLWEYFHKECQQYNIDPRAIIYVTGNLQAKEQYINWANTNNINKMINVVPYAHFEKDVGRLARSSTIPSVDENLAYKANNDIKLFNCLNKRKRNHRLWFNSLLVDAGLTARGLISMNTYVRDDTWLEGRALETDQVTRANALLPLLIYGENNIEHPDSYYINRIRTDVCLDSWISVVSEASLSDSDLTIFLSEKTFKPIAAKHPFIILGNKGSLTKLHELGYKTFDGFVDESYDSLPTFERMNAIIDTLKKIDAIDDKLLWYNSMRDIVDHNYNVLMSNSIQKSPALLTIESCFDDYFS